MNRRGHLSTKIPQVKLRPAPVGSSRRAKEASPINMIDEEIMRRALADAEDEETSTEALRRNSKPWKGITITFTGVESKAALTALAKELGGTVENALTIHVTHVVAVGYGSAKYLYAVEHSLPVMKPSWIEEAHAAWLNGDELDIEADEENHRLLPFIGLKIAMSGIEPLDRRKQLIKFIQSSGGQYSKDLDRSCTHLISAKPTNEPRSSEKVKWALREIAELEARKRKGVRTDEEEMKIVYEEWVWDCVAYKGRWKEDYYDARKARRGGKVIPEDVINGRISLQSNKNVTTDGATASKAALDSNEPAVMRKRKRESINTLVTELVSTTGTKPRDKSIPKRSLSPPKPPTSAAALDQQPDRKPSLLHVSRSTSFAINAPREEKSDLDRTTAIPPVIDQSTMETEDTRQDIAADALIPKRFFEGLRFSHVIQEQCDGLENAIRQHGGTVINDENRREGERVDYIIVRLCSEIRPHLSESDKDTIVVTECWVEGCCFEETLLTPDKHIVFRPLPAEMPIQDASKLIVHLSGFSAENNVYMRRLLRAIGGTLSVKLNRQSTHLITAVTTGQKVEKAREWGVKVMKDSWLIATGRSGKIEPEADHVLSPAVEVTRIPGRTSDLTANMSTISNLPDNSDFALRQSSSKPTSQLPLISPGRMLKPSPTHIDDAMTSTSSIGGHGSRTTTSIIQDNNVLSPPKVSTERILNSAIPHKSASEIIISEPSKLAKFASAPISESLAARQLTTKAEIGNSLGERAASTGSLGMGKSITNGGGMTEALRQLAEKDGSTSGKGRVIRRPRPSARIKNTRSPINSVSPAASRISGPPSPSHIDPDTSYFGADGTSAHDAEGNIPMIDNVAEESVQVRYVDAVSARERKKIRAMFNGPDEDGGSAKKRRK
ncbi:uncharacterized protein I206_103516 [Kwoniella pini CBS 10737]|uniref:BRCT domain-containing protein n=1 Tax=Kwoniella pini CBS 10737 TaxID=1296096 RepID=A0A1B9I9I0_9TREE|nr:uncharacterized protein I206_01480 [Kwoniella pini CBS 10737]OCF52195.1 hypothetical protein I206_01480 [Kwoniella pini CBS 10737]